MTQNITDAYKKDMVWLKDEYYKVGCIIRSAREGRFGNADVKPLIQDLWLYQARLLGWMDQISRDI